MLFLLNKNNFGFVTPDEFNSFAHQAQLDLFNEMFQDYSDSWNKTVEGTRGTDFGDQVTVMENAIDTFVVPSFALTGTGNVFNEPTDCFKFNRLYYGSKLVDKVNQSKIQLLLNSDRTAPTTMFPVHTKAEGIITVYPATITTNVFANYIRFPKIPKWTYIVTPGAQDPLFNQSDPSYQDFELPQQFEVELTVRVLQMCGLSIREQEVTQASKQEELQMKQEKYV